VPQVGAGRPGVGRWRSALGGAAGPVDGVLPAGNKAVCAVDADVRQDQGRQGHHLVGGAEADRQGCVHEQQPRGPGRRVRDGWAREGQGPEHQRGQ